MGDGGCGKTQIVTDNPDAYFQCPKYPRRSDNRITLKAQLKTNIVGYHKSL
jgi:hypothetical protein